MAGLRPRGGKRKALVLTVQIALIAALLCGWEFIPEIPGVHGSFNLVNPYFISSPSRIWDVLFDLLTGRNGVPRIYSFLWPTSEAALLGTAIGMLLGGALGLVLSSFDFLRSVLHPFIVAANAVPRIVLIPVIIIIVGVGITAEITTVVLVTLFVAFFNAFEGGSSVAPEVIHNARIFQASSLQIMLHIRLPYVFAWTFVTLPLALTFALVTAVTAEILMGFHGLGLLVSDALAEANSSLTFAVAFVVAVEGMVFVLLSELLRKRLLHWWVGQRGL